LCLEALEDRCVPSTSGAPPAAVPPPQVNHLAGLAITAYAGQTFSGVVATFNSPETDGLESTIDWADGHESPGTIASAGGQMSAILGTNTFALSGSYTMVISIATPPGHLATVQVQATATVLAPARTSSAGSIMAPMGPPTGSENFDMVALGVSSICTQGGSSAKVPTTAYGGAASINIPAVQTPPPHHPAAVSSPQRNAAQYQVAVQYQVSVPYQVDQQYQMAGPPQVTGPPRISTTDLVSWSSTRDQGLNMPAWPNLEVANVSAPGSQIIISASTIPASSPPVTVMTIMILPGMPATTIVGAGANVSEEIIPTPFATSVLGVAFTVLVQPSDTSVRPETPGNDGRTTDPLTLDGSEEPGETADVYHQPLYRIAGRSELGGMPGSVANQPAASLATFVPLPALGRSQEAEELERPGHSQGPLHFSDCAKSPGSLVEAAAVWAVFQALHAAEVAPPKPATVPNKAASRPSSPT
jgi:hypothetical protein